VHHNTTRQHNKKCISTHHHITALVTWTRLLSSVCTLLKANSDFCVCASFEIYCFSVFFGTFLDGVLMCSIFAYVFCSLFLHMFSVFETKMLFCVCVISCGKVCVNSVWKGFWWMLLFSVVLVFAFLQFDCMTMFVFLKMYVFCLCGAIKVTFYVCWPLRYFIVTLLFTDECLDDEKQIFSL